MNIIIPMAGRGQRFVDAGYKMPKPLIDINGQPMIMRVIDNIAMPDAKYIFLCLREFVDQYQTELLAVQAGLDCKTVVVDAVTEGAACTVMLAKDLIDTEDEMIIVNSDQLVLDPYYMKNSIEYYRKRKADGGVLCFLNNHPKWSYARIVEGRITEIVEKQVISDIATVGVYYYKTGKLFIDAATNMIRNNIRVNGEFYVAPTYNMMIVSGLNIVPFLINDMVGLGVPSDLERYLNEIGKTQ